MAWLPDLPGPKLHPFSDSSHLLKIKFIERLGTGGDSTVWKVDIDKKIYALKIFGFQLFLFRPRGVHKILRDLGHTAETHHPYNDYFTSECRAFGRLIETSNEHLAIKCFGYIILTEEQEQALIAAGGGDEEAIQRDDEKLKNEPLRCILKELIEVEDRPLELRPRRIPQMIKELHEVHRLGIVLLDVREDNYLNGRMMDFSRSMTVPHPRMHPKLQESIYAKPWPFTITARGDEENFDSMIDRYNESIESGGIKGPRIWVRIRPSEDMKKRLRNWVDIYEDGAEIDNTPQYPRVRAELYDWKATEKEQQRQRDPILPVVVEPKHGKEIDLEEDKHNDADVLRAKGKKKSGKNKKKKRKTKAKRR
ncbi:kinetochore Sim4 complex subunit FTA2-domain-containing protein [Xylariaceae sp. FL1019]|nr:kinetochore Sim4 complex subunit FTA2-domain-containing protein [Xylariaceae sp. FL1019]